MPQGPRRIGEIFGNSDRCVFLTVNCWERARAFSRASFAERVREELLHSAAAFKIEILAYTLMPDHVHVLSHVKSGGCVWEFMRRWKQKTGYWWKQDGHGHSLWQRGYHDRVLRLDEDREAVAAYIVMNPVRARLASTPQGYQFCGAPGFDMARLVSLNSECRIGGHRTTGVGRDDG